MIQSIFEADRLQRLGLIGEDTSDLLLAIERSFDITFSADDLVQATTVGKLAECVSNKVELPALRPMP
jgi:phosphopantetheine binding protein